MIEIWKPITGFENHYEASSMGRIRSINREVNCGRCIDKNRIIKGREINFYINKNGYEITKLSKNNKSKTQLVSRIIAITFIPNPLNLPVVNHINGRKTDNRVENLEWATYAWNNLHSYRILGRKSALTGRLGIKSKCCKGSISVYDSNMKLIKTFESIHAATLSGHHRSGINYSLNSNRKHKGLFFKWSKNKL